MGVRGLTGLECVIDSHAHIPSKPSPRMALASLLIDMRRAGVDGVVILGLPRINAGRITLEEVREGHSKVRGLIERYARDVMHLLTPEALLETVKELASSYGPLCELLGETPPATVLLAGVDLDLEPEKLAGWLREAWRRGAGGFKIVSTLQFKYLDDPSVEVVLEASEDLGVPVVVHGGCDPGIWELPAYCKYGDPSRLEAHLARHRDSTVVISHAGGYSAIAPGVFTEEALSLARRYDNVYLDISAIPAWMGARIALSLPPGKVLYGSDYPVVVGSSLRDHVLEVYAHLKSLGAPGSLVEELYHNAAERIFGVKCGPQH